MKKSLLCILLFFVASSLKAQVFEPLHSDRYLKVLQDTAKNSSINPYYYSDYRNNGFHLLYELFRSDTTHSLLVDENLNLIDNKIPNNRIFTPAFYSNNKIYNFRGGVSGVFPVSYFTFLPLISYDSIGNLLRVDTIIRETDDTIKWSIDGRRIEMLEDKTMLLILREVYPIETYEFDTMYDLNRSNSLKMIKFDTLGNVLKSKIIYEPLCDYDFCEMPNHIIFFLGGALSTSQMHEKSKIYYLNKETLEPEDSIMGYHPSNMTKINDSLFAFHYYFAQQLEGSPEDTIASICLMNINTKHHINTDFRYYMDYSNNIFMKFESDPMTKVIDFKTTDSIYACYIIRDGFYNYCAIEICNFNINGDTNFVNRINLSTGGFKQIQAIHATNDGGMLLVAYSLDSGSSGKLSTWLLKFHPKGEIGLRNIETGEKETIKVYPNPAKDYINVDIECSNFKKSEIELFDMQGRLVKKAKLNLKKANRVDVSNLNAGAYTYNVMLNGKTISGKVIVGK